MIKILKNQKTGFTPAGMREIFANQFFYSKEYFTLEHINNSMTQ